MASSVGNLYQQQALENIGRFIDEPDSIPSLVDISSGIVQTSGSASVQVGIPYGNQVTEAVASGASPTVTGIQLPSKVITPSASDNWQQSWTITPVSDSNALRRIRALFQYVTASGDAADQRLLTEYDLNPTLANNTATIDASRVLEPQCVICMNPSEIKLPQVPTSVRDLGNSKKFHINPQLISFRKALCWSERPPSTKNCSDQAVKLGVYGTHIASAWNGSMDSKRPCCRISCFLSSPRVMPDTHRRRQTRAPRRRQSRVKNNFVNNTPVRGQRVEKGFRWRVLVSAPASLVTSLQTVTRPDAHGSVGLATTTAPGRCISRRR